MVPLDWSFSSQLAQQHRASVTPEYPTSPHYPLSASHAPGYPAPLLLDPVTFDQLGFA